MPAAPAPVVRAHRATTLLAVLALAVSAACTAERGAGGSEGLVADRAELERPPAPPASVAPEPPALKVAARSRAVVGTEVAVPVAAAAADGGPLSLSVEGLPAGAELRGDHIRFRPGTAGTWTVTVHAADATGARTSDAVVLEARHPRRPGTLVGLGDSVASGQGLQRRDLLGRDACWRAEGDAYPRLVYDEWRAGRSGPTEFALVACSGMEVADLLRAPVGGGPTDAAPRGSDTLAQVEWAVRANPGVVTLTVGANDLDFVNPERSLDGDRIDEGRLATRLADLAADLDRVLARLVDATDATVVVTTYHDPTAARPHGVAGCEGACFADAAAEVVDALNRTIRTAADAQPAERVRVADVAPRFAGHGAPNGVGPDGLRSGSGAWPLSLLDDAFASTTGTTHAFCARGDDGGGSWISALDCVHPDARGARAYADAVLEALGD